VVNLNWTECDEDEVVVIDMDRCVSYRLHLSCGVASRGTKNASRDEASKKSFYTFFLATYSKKLFYSCFFFFDVIDGRMDRAIKEGVIDLCAPNFLFSR
jgi:hypothetical protein